MELTSDGYYGYGGGDGSGYGYGSGYGGGDGSGYGYGSGSGYGSGCYGGGYYGGGYGGGYYGGGYGDRDEFAAFLAVSPLAARRALSLPNAELRRVAIEALGPDRFFAEMGPIVVHEDTDGMGNPRRLLRVPLTDAMAGYLMAVQVMCPTTGRVYHLGVQPGVCTCQEAVASTFGLDADQYQPVRET